MSTKANRRSIEELRAEAIREARGMIAEGGLDKVKARLLALRLGVSVGMIYNLFGRLDELLFHVSASVYEELQAAIEADLEIARAKSASTTDLMLCLSQTYLHFVAANQDLWSGVLAFNRRGKQEVPDWYHAKERAILGIAETTIAGLSSDLPQNKAALAATALWAAVHGIVTVSIGRGGLIATEEEVWAQISLVVTSVAATLENEASTG
ncbi:MAG: TetR/AcrR family transcriptional regulator [Pseudomonadota bacterium]